MPITARTTTEADASVEAEERATEDVLANPASADSSRALEEESEAPEVVPNVKPLNADVIQKPEAQKSAPEAESVSKKKRDYNYEALILIVQDLVALNFPRTIDKKRLTAYVAAFAGLGLQELQFNYIIFALGILYLLVNVFHVQAGRDCHKHEDDSLKHGIDKTRAHQVEKIAQLTQEQSDIMTAMAKEEGLDPIKLSQFNDLHVQICGKGKSCKASLGISKKKLEKMLRCVRRYRWAFNGIKCLCVVAAGWLGGFYEVCKNNTSLIHNGAFVIAVCSVCFDLYCLNVADEVYEDLKGKQMELIELEQRVENLITTEIGIQDKRMTMKKQYCINSPAKTGSQATN